VDSRIHLLARTANWSPAHGTVKLTVDGTSRGAIDIRLGHTIAGLTLGPHTVQLHLVDNGGATVASSSIVNFTVVDAIPGHERLEFDIIDAEFDTVHNRHVVVTANPDGIATIDAGTNAIRHVQTPLPGACVSISPDGTQAVVGHDARLTKVNLAAMTTTTAAVTCDIFDIVHGGNGFAYCFPRFDQSVQIHCIDLATGIETYSERSIWQQTFAKRHPSGIFIYGADYGLRLQKYDISSGTAGLLYNSSYCGDYVDGNLWISEDGTRLFARSGNIFTSSPVQAQDMQYIDRFSNTTSVTSLDTSAEMGIIALTPATPTTVQFYDGTDLSYQQDLPLPTFTAIDATTHAGHGRYLFFDAPGTTCHVLLRAVDSLGQTYAWAVVHQPTPAIINN
jgi:hypothetical protein